MPFLHYSPFFYWVLLDERLTASLRANEDDLVTIDDLKSQLEKTWSKLEASYQQDEASKKTISNLQNDILNLRDQIGRYETQLGDYASIDHVIAHCDSLAAMLKVAENSLLVEKQRSEALTRELSARTAKYREKKSLIKDFERRLTQKASEENKLIKEKNSIEDELVRSKAELIELSKKLETLHKSLADESASKSHQMVSYEILQKSYNAVLSESLSLKSQVQKLQDNLQEMLESSNKISEEKETAIKEIRTQKTEISKLKTQLTKSAVNLEKSEKEKSRLQKEYNTLEEQAKAFKMQISGLEQEIGREKSVQRSLEDGASRLQKERESALKRAAIESNKLMQTRNVLESVEGEVAGLGNENKSLLKEKRDMEHEIAALKRERERLKADLAEMASALEDAESEIATHEAALKEAEKRENESKIRLKTAQSSMENMRMERNAINKALSDANEEISELKRKSKVGTNQILTLKDELHEKDKSLVAEQFESSSLTKRLEQRVREVDELKNIIASLHEQINTHRHTIEELQIVAKKKDDEMIQQKRAYDAIVIERDVLATQLTRRNDEIAILAERTALQENVLKKGKSEYDARMDEIQTFKNTIRDLMRKLAIADASISITNELRNETTRLHWELLAEQAKCKALVEEIENPSNVHRWRKLEGSDPGYYEAIQKVATLQKKVILKSEAIVEKDQLIAEKDKELAALHSKIAKLEELNLTDQLTATQRSLSDRTHQLKALAGESNMALTQLAEAQTEVEALRQELYELKEKYYDLKKKETLRKEALSTPSYRGSIMSPFKTPIETPIKTPGRLSHSISGSITHFENEITSPGQSFSQSPPSFNLSGIGRNHLGKTNLSLTGSSTPIRQGATAILASPMRVHTGN